MKNCMALLVAGAFFATVTGVQATSLNPGDSGVAVTSISSLPTGVVIADTGLQPVSAINKAGHGYTATLQSYVIKEGDGSLDFVYTITNTSVSPLKDVVELLTMTDFTSATGVKVNFLAGSGVAPTDANYSADGSVVSFDYSTKTGAGIVPGSSSTVVIHTDPNGVVDGSYSVADGITVNAAGFAPAPLPSSVVLFSTGALGLFGNFFRRFRKAPALMV